MRKLIYSMMVSFDGFIEGPNRELDWHIIDEELHTFINDQQSEFDTYLYGRRLYEVMTYWETADKKLSSPEYELEFARIWKSIPKIVFSKTLEQVQGNARLIRDNIVEEITKLKAQPGKDMSLGGANLASTFIQLGLIDEYRLFIHPVVLGSGTPFFPTLDVKINLRLVETRDFGSGVVYLRYQHADEGQQRLRYSGTILIEETLMCRNIKTLFNFEPPVTDAEIRAASLQFVRKVSGFNKPSKVNEAAFLAAVDEVDAVTRNLLSSLETNAPPKNRIEEAARARARAAQRFSKGTEV